MSIKKCRTRKSFLSPKETSSVYTSLPLESSSNLVIYSQLSPSEKERKKLPFILIISLIFVTGGFGMIITGKGEDILKGWGILFFFGICLSFTFIQVIWDPLLVVNEQGICIHPNPLSKGISLQWCEIEAIALSSGSHKSCLGFALSPEYIETFLQRQPFLTRKILERRLKRFHLIALLPQWLLPYSRTALLANIQDQYYEQLQQHHITLETNV